MNIYRKTGLTLSPQMLMSSGRRLGFPDGLLDIVTFTIPQIWRPSVTPSPPQCKKLLARQAFVFSSFTYLTPDAVTSCAWPAVSYCSQHGLLRLCRFLHYFTPKTSEIASFVIFLSKVPKMRKGTIYGNIWSIKYELGLKWPPKSVTLFHSSVFQFELWILSLLEMED